MALYYMHPSVLLAKIFSEKKFTSKKKVILIFQNIGCWCLSISDIDFHQPRILIYVLPPEDLRKAQRRHKCSGGALYACGGPYGGSFNTVAETMEFNPN